MHSFVKFQNMNPGIQMKDDGLLHIFIYEVYSLNNAKHLLIPSFNVEILRFIAFKNGMDIGFLLRKVKFVGIYHTGYEH